MRLRTCAHPALIAALVAGCGASEAPEQSDAPQASVAQSAASSPCEILERLVPEAVSMDPASISFEPGGRTNPYCQARWRKANADELEARQSEAVADYMSRRMEARARGETFEEAMPTVTAEGTIMLTIASNQFEDDAAAVAALETVVGRLAEGITVESEGTSATFQSDYDEPVSGVGAGAAWSNRMSQISVAARSRLFHLTVRVHDDAAANRALAEELARTVVNEL